MEAVAPEDRCFLKKGLGHCQVVMVAWIFLVKFQISKTSCRHKVGQGKRANTSPEDSLLDLKLRKGNNNLRRVPADVGARVEKDFRRNNICLRVRFVITEAGGTISA